MNIDVWYLYVYKCESMHMFEWICITSFGCIRANVYIYTCSLFICKDHVCICDICIHWCLYVCLLNAFMFAYKEVCTGRYVFLYMYVWMYGSFFVWINLCMFTYTYVYVHIFMYACAHVWLYVCVYTTISTCTIPYVCMCEYICLFVMRTWLWKG